VANANANATLVVIVTREHSLRLEDLAVDPAGEPSPSDELRARCELVAAVGEPIAVVVDMILFVIEVVTVLIEGTGPVPGLPVLGGQAEEEGVLLPGPLLDLDLDLLLVLGSELGRRLRLRLRLLVLVKVIVVMVMMVSSELGGGGSRGSPVIVEGDGHGGVC